MSAQDDPQLRRFHFILFVAGDTPNSARARVNLNALCRRHIAHRHEIEIVDVLQSPGRALADGVFMTPTLVCTAPGAVRKVVGSLSDAQVVLGVLGIDAVAP